MGSSASLYKQQNSYFKDGKETKKQNNVPNNLQLHVLATTVIPNWPRWAAVGQAYLLQKQKKW